MSRDPQSTPLPTDEQTDWAATIEGLTDELERTRSILEAKTAAWNGALQANANLHEKIASLEIAVRRLSDDNIDLTRERDQHFEAETVSAVDVARLRAALEKISKHRLRGRKTQAALLAEQALKGELV